MYDGESGFLVQNPLDRYLINSPMLPNLKRDVDGGLTLYLQHESPGGELESNWLPAPNGPFCAIMRLYWPEPDALEVVFLKRFHVFLKTSTWRRGMLEAPQKSESRLKQRRSRAHE